MGKGGLQVKVFLYFPLREKEKWNLLGLFHRKEKYNLFCKITSPPHLENVSSQYHIISSSVSRYTANSKQELSKGVGVLFTRFHNTFLEWVSADPSPPDLTWKDEFTKAYVFTCPHSTSLATMCMGEAREHWEWWHQSSVINCYQGDARGDVGHQKPHKVLVACGPGFWWKWNRNSEYKDLKGGKGWWY